LYLNLCKCLACHTDEDDASQLALQEHDEETSTEAKSGKVRNDLQQETISGKAIEKNNKDS
jgi:hypothetical protein